MGFFFNPPSQTWSYCWLVNSRVKAKAKSLVMVGYCARTGRGKREKSDRNIETVNDQFGRIRKKKNIELIPLESQQTTLNSQSYIKMSFKV